MEPLEERRVLAAVLPGAAGAGDFATALFPDIFNDLPTDVQDVINGLGGNTVGYVAFPGEINDVTVSDTLNPLNLVTVINEAAPVTVLRVLPVITDKIVEEVEAGFSFIAEITVPIGQLLELPSGTALVPNVSAIVDLIPGLGDLLVDGVNAIKNFLPPTLELPSFGILGGVEALGLPVIGDFLGELKDVASEAVDFVLDDFFPFGGDLTGTAFIESLNSFVEFVTGTFDVGGIFIGTLDGNDRVDLTRLSTFAEVAAGEGSDFIVDGLGETDLILGPGDDVVQVNNQKDAAGVTTINGGPGNDTLFINGTQRNDNIELMLNGMGQLVVTVNASTNTYDLTGMERIQIVANEGDDTVTVDTSNGALEFDQGINIDGGDGTDRIVVDGTLTATSNNHLVGPFGSGTGASIMEINGATQIINYEGMDPVLDVFRDSVPGPLNVTATPNANSVTVRQGSTADFGLIEVDSDLSLDFTNKDNVTINAGSGDDEIRVDATNIPTGLMKLTVNADGGNDRVTTTEGVDFNLEYNGGAGHDYLDAAGVNPATVTLNGTAGNDTLIGGNLNDELNGGAGDDLLVPGGGMNLVNGGTGFDVLAVWGTPGNDRVDVNQTAANMVTTDVNGLAGSNPLSGIQALRVETYAGSDIIRVEQNDGLVAAPSGSLPITVDGGPGSASDRLAVVDDWLGDVVIQRVSHTPGAGSFTVGPLAPVEYEGVEFTQVTPLDPITGTTGDDGLGRFIVFKPDEFEDNNALPVATLLGADAAINIDPTIDPGGDAAFNLPGDEDWFEFIAQFTGTLDVRVLFEELPTLPNGRAGLPGDGNLDIIAYDIDGTPIAGVTDFGNNDGPGELEVDGDPFAEDERVRIPVVAGQTYLLRVQGAVPEAINNYSLSVINTAAPIAYDLELDDTPPGDDTIADNPANSDTGRSQFDNHTRDLTPLIFFRLDDAELLQDLPGNALPDTPPDEVIPIPFDPSQAADPTGAGYRVAVFVNGDSDPENPDELPQVPVGYARMIADGIYAFDFETDALAAPFLLSDGSHFLSVRVQMVDPADPTQTGFGPRSESFEIVVDTADPPVFFGNAANPEDGLHPSSDSHVEGDVDPSNDFDPNQNIDTRDDRVTNDVTPTFWGVAEANSIVRMYLDLDDDMAFDPANDLLLGEAVALPEDGTNQFPAGHWTYTSDTDLNDPDVAAALARYDGLRTLFITAEDPAGNVSDPQTLQIFLDTQGPQITDVRIDGEPTFDLFDPKPTVNGPTPLVNALNISVQDLPLRDGVDPNFLYQALIENIIETPGNIQVSGDQHGNIAIADVVWTPDPFPANDGEAAFGTITVTFEEPLPDDRFTLRILDTLVDPANNDLDGETNGVQPLEDIAFPSGDGVAGGDFVARFTIDSRPEVGTFASQNVTIDINGNLTWDPDGADNDFVNRDLAFVFGQVNDYKFAGKFHLQPNQDLFTGDANGFDSLAAYGPVNDGDVFHWLIDRDGNGAFDPAIDIETFQPAGFQIDGLPVAGEFDGNPDNGDEIGLFDGLNWWLDTNHDFIIDANDLQISGTLGNRITGFPIVGDFDGDGLDDLATYEDNVFQFDLADDGLNGNLDLGTRIEFGFDGVLERPVAADMDGDGIDDAGLWVPVRTTQDADERVEWYFLLSDDLDESERVFGTINTLDHAFSPVPLGTDLFAAFGEDFALPVIGNFDPPITRTLDQLVDFEDGVLTVHGTAGDDEFGFDASAGDSYSLVINGGEFTFAAGDITAINFNGGDGNDSVTLTTGPGYDKALILPDRASLNGDGYKLTIDGVSNYVLNHDAGDLAKIFGNRHAADVWVVEADTSTLSGEGYSISVNGAGEVVADGRSGDDHAAMTGSNDPLARDILVANSHKVRLLGPSYDVKTFNFESHAVDSAEGDDKIWFYGSAADEEFTSQPGFARFTGGGLNVEASGFDLVKVRSGGGDDLAELSGTDGDDLFVSKSDFSRMAAGGYTTIAFDFARTVAHDSGGHDEARFSDAGTLAASLSEVRYSGNGFDTTATGFNEVRVYGDGGKATLHDAAFASEHLKLRSHYAKLSSDSAMLVAMNFDEIDAITSDDGLDTIDQIDDALDYAFARTGDWR